MPIIELNLSETDIIDARVNVSFDRLTVILRNLVDESNEHHNDIEDLKNLLKSEKARGDELERLVKRDTTENSIIEMTKEIEDIKKVLGDLKDEVEQTVTDNKKIFSVFEEGIASNAEELKKEQESVEIIQKQVNGLQFPSLKEGTPLEKLVAELNEFRNKSEPRILAFDAFIECWSADTSKLIDLCEKNYEGHFITSNQTRTDYILSLPPFIECSNQYKTRDELLRGALEERFGIYETTSQRSRGPANAERGSDSAVSEGHKLNDDAMGSPLKAPGYEKDTSYESQDPQSDNARDVDGDTNAEVATLVKEAKTQQQAVRKALGILDNSVKVQEDLPRRVAALEDVIRSLGPKKSNVELFDTKADNSKSEGQDQSLDERISDAHSILPPSAANEELRWRVGELETEVARLEEKKADRDELVGLYNSIDNVHDVDQIGISNTHKLNNLKEDVGYGKVLPNQDVCQKPDSAVHDGYGEGVGVHGLPGTAEQGGNKKGRMGRSKNSDNAGGDGDTNAEVAHLVNEVKSQQQAVRKALGILDNSVKVQEDLPRRVAALEDVIRSLGPKKSNVELFDTKADNSKSEGQDQSLDEFISNAQSILPPSSGNEDLQRRVGELETEVARLEEKKADRDELVGLYNSIDNVHDVDQIGISNTHKLNNLKEDVGYGKVLPNQDVCQKPDSAVHDGYGEGVGVHGLPGTAEQGGKKSGRMGRSKNSDNGGGDGDTNAEVAHLVNEVKSQQQAVRKALGILDNSVKVQEDLPRRVAALEDVIRSLGPKKSNVELFDTKADNSKSEGQDQSLDERISNVQRILPASAGGEQLRRRVGELETEVARLEERKADRDELVGLYNSIDNVHDVDKIDISSNNKLNNLKEDVGYGKVLPNQKKPQPPQSTLNRGYGEGVGVHGLRGAAELGGRKNGRMGGSKNTEAGGDDGYTNAEVAHLVNEAKTQQQAVRNALGILDNTVKVQEDLPRRVAALEDVIRSPGDHKIHADQIVNCPTCGTPSRRGSLQPVPNSSITPDARGAAPGSNIASGGASGGNLSSSGNNVYISNESTRPYKSSTGISRLNDNNPTYTGSSSLPAIRRPGANTNNVTETDQIVSCPTCGTHNRRSSFYPVSSGTITPHAHGSATGGNLCTSCKNVVNEGARPYNSSSSIPRLNDNNSTRTAPSSVPDFHSTGAGRVTPRRSTGMSMDVNNSVSSVGYTPRSNFDSPNQKYRNISPDVRNVRGVSREIIDLRPTVESSRSDSANRAGTTPVRVFMGRTVATVRDCNGYSIPASIGCVHY